MFQVDEHTSSLGLNGVWSVTILQRAAMLSAVLATAFLCVTRQYCVKTNELRMMPCSQPGSPFILDLAT